MLSQPNQYEDKELRDRIIDITTDNAGTLRVPCLDSRQIDQLVDLFNTYKGAAMDKTIKEIVDLHIQPLVKEDQYNDVQQAVEELEQLITQKQLEARLDELELSFAKLLPQTQTPDPGNDSGRITVNSDSVWAYKVTRTNELKKGLPQ